MGEFVERLCTSDGFMPHGHCYHWQPEIVWLHVVSDALIAMSYTTIPFTLWYFVRKRKDLPFHWMFICFGLFIVACGTTHMMEIWTLWNPTYRLSGVIKAITAAASVPTAILLVRLVPQALSIPSPASLREANAALQRTSSQLRVANQELESFSYSVAHDLRAPLRAMNGFAQILAADYRDKLDAEGQDHLHEIQDNARKMGHLIDALLGLSRVTRSALNATDVDLSEVARAVGESLASEHADHAVSYTVAPGMHEKMDPALARNLLENLVGNAWKFTRDTAKPEIEVGSTEQEGSTVYFVRDNGAGFDMQYADKLFQPFQRLHAQADFAGTGIGLATVARIVHRHGGRVWAESSVARGATFYFSLTAETPRST